MNNLVLLIILAVGLFYVINQNKKEGFSNKSGQFCVTCDGKTPNQCFDCANCGFCVDLWGNAQCVGGDVHGPYNNKKCQSYYHGDPYARMIQSNANYKCSPGQIDDSRIV